MSQGRIFHGFGVEWGEVMRRRLAPHCHYDIFAAMLDQMNGYDPC